MSEILTKRAYEKRGKEDGYRILVERLWPRGIKKEDLPYSWWPKDIAPSKELRQWYQHDTDKFADFKKKYKQELADNDLRTEFLDKVSMQLKKHNVTFLFGSKEETYNSATVLKEWTEEQLNQ